MNIKNIFSSTIMAIAVASASTPVAAEKTEYVFSSGGKSTVPGSYYDIGETIAEGLRKKGIKATNIESGGSIMNIDRLNDGEVSAALVQKDAINMHPLSISYVAKPLTKKEKIFWVFNKKLGYQDVKDVEGNTDVLIVVVEGSGAEVTLQNFAKEDEGYKPNYSTALYVDEVYDAVELVANGDYKGKPVVGMLHVGSSLPTNEVKDFRQYVLVGEATDKDFNDFTDDKGDHLYESCSIDSNVMGGLDKSTTFSPDTVCVDAVLVYNTDHPDNRKAKRVINRTANKF